MRVPSTTVDVQVFKNATLATLDAEQTRAVRGIPPDEVEGWNTPPHLVGRGGRERKSIILATTSSDASCNSED